MRHLLAFAAVLAVVPVTGAAEVSDLIAQIQQVGAEGAGNANARKAWTELVGKGPAVLPALLRSMSDKFPVTANWLRSAFETVAENELKAGRPLPKTELEKFLHDVKADPGARRLAYEWLVRVEPTASEKWLPQLLNDPSVELRRDAVAKVLDEAQAAMTKAKASYQKALAGARDRDQVDLIAKQLKALGETVNVTTHFGFIQQWQLVGPFDSTGGIGFAKAYEPETAVDLAKKYSAKGETEVGWKQHATPDAYGMVDLNKAIGKHMGAVGYAFAAVDSPKAMPVEVRVGSNNAVQVWLNGERLIRHEEYHHGVKMDQYVGRSQLKAGRNEILVKVCQNEQKDEWAQTWGFQLRLCDSVGGAVPFTLIEKKE